MLRLTSALAAIAFACPAVAQQPSCFPMEDALTQLSENYGELPSYVMSTDSGALFMLTANEESGTWTLLAIPNGDEVCLLASGENFAPVSQEMKDSIQRLGGEEV